MATPLIWTNLMDRVYRYTLSNSNVGVASLLCALFPCFPLTGLDNQYHLQALRHLYVLAAKPAVLVARETETGEARCVRLQVKVQGGEVREMVTPCLVQDWEKLEEVRKEGVGEGGRG